MIASLMVTWQGRMDIASGDSAADASSRVQARSNELDTFLHTNV